MVFLLFTAKSNPNGHFPIPIIYVFSIHLWHQNCTVFNVTGHVWRRYGSISYSHHNPQILLTSYRMNSTCSTIFKMTAFSYFSWQFYKTKTIFLMTQTLKCLLSVNDKIFVPCKHQLVTVYWEADSVRRSGALASNQGALFDFVTYLQCDLGMWFIPYQFQLLHVWDETSYSTCKKYVQWTQYTNRCSSNKGFFLFLCFLSL